MRLIQTMDLINYQSNMPYINYFIIQMLFVLISSLDWLPCKERKLFSENIKKVFVKSYHQCSIKWYESGSNRLICKIESCDFFYVKHFMTSCRMIFIIWLNKFIIAHILQTVTKNSYTKQVFSLLNRVLIGH